MISMTLDMDILILRKNSYPDPEPKDFRKLKKKGSEQQ